MRLKAIFCVIAVPIAAWAQSGPSFDCDKAQGSVETLICVDAELARLDRIVADRYAAALEAAEAVDAGAAEAVAELRGHQRGWVSGRNECWKAEDLRGCVANSYLRREGELVASWDLEEPTGTVFWTCDGNPANEVVTTFFATDLPSVRIERGDTVDTGSLSRTASGSRYDGSFGRYIWIRGDEAIYREADPEGTTLECIVARRQ